MPLLCADAAKDGHWPLSSEWDVDDPAAKGRLVRKMVEELGLTMEDLDVGAMEAAGIKVGGGGGRKMGGGEAEYRWLLLGRGGAGKGREGI